jgi:large subunit ribosomal protein L21
LYAVIESGGKQYKVEVGQTLRVERMAVPAGSTVEMERVLLVRDGDTTLVGNPTVPGAKVLAKVLGEVKGDKVTVFKFKPKVSYRVKSGHRQLYTNLAIKDIVVGSGKKSKRGRDGA